MYTCRCVDAQGWFAQWVASGKLGTFLERDELDIPADDSELMEELGSSGSFQNQGP